MKHLAFATLTLLALTGCQQAEKPAAEAVDQSQMATEEKKYTKVSDLQQPLKATYKEFDVYLVSVEDEGHFYMAKKGEDRVVQQNLSGPFVHKGEEQLVTTTIGNETFLMYKTATDTPMVALFVIDEGALKIVPINGSDYVIANHSVKQIDGGKLQYAIYGKGHLTFKTVEYDVNTQAFTLLAEETISDEQQMESAMAAWTTNEAYYHPYPQIDIHEAIRNISQYGYYIYPNTTEGIDIDVLTSQRPDYNFPDEYFEGGKYIHYGTGEYVFFDPNTNLISGLWLSGSGLKNTSYADFIATTTLPYHQEYDQFFSAQSVALPDGVRLLLDDTSTNITMVMKY